jgi:hypothetical protein
MDDDQSAGIARSLGVVKPEPFNVRLARLLNLSSHGSKCWRERPRVAEASERYEVGGLQPTGHDVALVVGVARM